MTSQISIKTQFGWISAYEINGKIFKIKFGKTKRQIKSRPLINFKENLIKFLNKKNKHLNASYELRGSNIQKKVWSELKKIKPGKTKSYGEIAKKYKMSPRQVGKICGQNKLVILIPCHRVIRTDGTLGGFSAPKGIRLKKNLLNFEKE